MSSVSLMSPSSQSVTENDLTGPFPEEILDLTFMELLYISFNDITGTLPTRIGELADLREFYAYTNQMTGAIPSELGLLVELENLVIGKNQFSGQCWSCVHALLFSAAAPLTSGLLVPSHRQTAHPAEQSLQAEGVLRVLRWR